MSGSSTIDLNILRKFLEISDINLFPLYLKEVYKDLIDRAESNKAVGISKITFYEYVKLPVFISDKLFNALDKDNNNFLNLKEFVDGLNMLYYGTFKQSAKIIFNMYDFDKDGIISREDVKILFSYLPLKNENKQMESLMEIDYILSLVKIDNNFTFYRFLETVEKVKSDIYLQLLCFLYDHKPFAIENVEACRLLPKYIEYMQNNKGISVEELMLGSPMINSKTVSSAFVPEKINLSSPSKTTVFKPVDNIIKLMEIDEFNLDADDDDNEENNVKVTLPTNPNNKNYYNSNNNNAMISSSIINTDMVRMPNTREYKEEVEVFATPSNFLKNAGNFPNNDFLDLNSPSNDIDMFGGNNNFNNNNNNNFNNIVSSNLNNVFDNYNNNNLNNNIRIFSNNLSNNINTNSLTSKTTNISSNPSSIGPSKRKNTFKLKQLDIVTKGGIIYKLTESNNIKSYYLYLANKDIYYYKNENLKELLGMHSLTGGYVVDPTNNFIVYDNKKYFFFSIKFSNKNRIYYTETYEDALSWAKTLKKAIGYQSFTDTYTMESNTLGEGKFGLVKLGVHKKTGEKVAIKIIKKEAMSLKDQELVKSEIDIMKICKHPNIVRLLDHFENNEFIFIAMEFLAGGTLAQYLESTPVDELSEEDAGVITYQIARALEYLHQFGIAHRDLKPENIMIKGKLPYVSLDSLKVMDFGLSKIMGPNERVSDGFGTLTYVAPEVLTRKPYNKHVDIWSLGVIVFYTLSGTFPFDDPSNDEEIIAKKTVFSDVKFNHRSWPMRTMASKDFVLRCMTKDLEKRAVIGDIIKHQWFVECGIISGKKTNPRSATMFINK